MDDSERNRRRRQFLLIAALFFSPVIASWAVWAYLGEHGVAATTNAGSLIQPARPLQAVALTDPAGSALPDDFLGGRWTYLQFDQAGNCIAACRERLQLTRQVRLGVNKDIPRVRRVLVLGAAPSEELRAHIAEAHDDLVVAVAANPAAWQALRGQFPAPQDAPNLFLIDPLGNLMMRYDPAVANKGILKDLRKLLKTSQIG